MNKNKRGVINLKLAFTFIGTIIGAGFASGQEIRRYFTDFGYMGFIGLIFVAILFMIIGEKIMMMGYISKSDSYDRILNYGFRCKFKKVVDYILCFFLVATASTMFSGTGAFFNQTFGTPTAIVSFIMMIITAIFTILGIEKIMKVNSIIVPSLIILTCIISISSFWRNDLVRFTLINEVKTKSILPVLFSSIIYCSYNVIMAMPVLASLGSTAKSTTKIKITSIISGLIIGIFGSIIYFALLVNYDKIQGAEIPILTLAGSKYSLFYGVSFIIAVLTTAIGCLYGVYTRFDQNKIKFLFICLAAYVISLFGFSTLVAKLYYVMGLFGIFLLYMLLRGFNRRA